MGHDSSQPRTSTSRTVRLPATEGVPRTAERYRLVGIRINAEFNIGVEAPSGDGGSIEQFPQPVHDVLPEMAAETIDMHRLRADTTHEDWPPLGMITLSRQSGNTVTVEIEWLPSYLQTPHDETE